MSSVAAAVATVADPVFPAHSAVRLAGKVESIHAELRQEVLGGVWKTGERLPNEAKLAARFACSSGTVNKAIALMVHEGLVERRTRTGTRVVRNMPAAISQAQSGGALAEAAGTPGDAAAPMSRTRNIGIVLADNNPAWRDHPLVASYMVGVEEGCQRSGFHALMELSSDGGASLPRCVAEHKIDGLLVKTAHGLPGFLGQLPVNLPVVLVSVNNPAVSFPQIAPDNHGAGWSMTGYFWEKGHRRIAFLCSDSRHSMFIGRFQGYENCLRQKSAYDLALVSMVEKPANKIHEPEQTSPDMGPALDRLLALPSASRPTAILAANDWMAHGVYTALAARGLRIPDDISVAGFDNVTTLCETLVPQLTSFDLDLVGVARTAAELLADMIGKPAQKRSPSVHLVRGRLVPRQSVASLPAP
ncbi:MAG: GntR family transcriptional regulator [Opitutaceae bacterium]|jgi:LacI family transcriptional regulator|nr:GntR family transcriptional regulator [Opitutaceae bacterium]